MPLPLASVVRGMLQDVLRQAARQAAQQGSARVRAEIRQRIGQKIIETVKNLARETRNAERSSADDALDFARKLSSGPFSSSQLSAMGHPYRRGGYPPAPSFIINKQTGQFYRGWRVEGPRTVSGTLSTTLVNDAPHAKLLERGTRRMIPRPIFQVVRAHIAITRFRRHKRAIRKALTR